MPLEEAETLIEKIYAQVIANNPFDEVSELRRDYFTTVEFLRLSLLTHARKRVKKSGEVSLYTLLSILNVAEDIIEPLLLPDGILKMTTANYTKALLGGYGNELQPL